jgi:hypothetical protein
MAAIQKNSNRVFRLKHGKETMIPGVNDPFQFQDGQEFHIVADMMYMGGFPLPPGLQKPVMDWVLANPVLFVEDTRNF